MVNDTKPQVESRIEQNPTDDHQRIDTLWNFLQRNSWAGGNLLRGEVPRIVTIDSGSFASLTAQVAYHRWFFVVPGGAGVADAIYICIKNAADAYEFLEVSAGNTPSSSTSDLKDAMVANDIVTDGGATPLNLDGGHLTVGECEIDGALNHDGTTIGFYNTTPISKPTVTGSRGANAALATLLDALKNLGLLTDSSTI